MSIHDTTSFTAVKVKNMLHLLKSRGADIHVLSALCFTSQEGSSAFVDLKDKLTGNVLFFNVDDNGIPCTYIRTSTFNLDDIPSADQRNFYGRMCTLINSFKPDIVMGCGDDLLSMTCYNEAAVRNIPVVFAHFERTADYFDFQDIEAVFAESQALADFTAAKKKINVSVTGSFRNINVPKDLLPLQERKRISLIDPTAEKGLGVFLRLMQTGKDECDGYTFTVFESHPGQFQEECARLKEKSGDKSPFKDYDLSRVQILTQGSDLAQMLKESRVLVVPSLRFENIIPYVRDAVSMNVPILGTGITGVKESAAGAGITVEVPEYCLTDPCVVPAKGDMKQINAALKKLLTEDFTEQCLQAQKSFDLNISANNLIQILKPLFDRRAGNNPQLFRMGSIF